MFLDGYGPAILEGAWVTLRLALLSLSLAFVAGLAGAAAKLSGTRMLVWPATAYSTLFRGVPDLVMMLIVFYGGQVMVNQITDALGCPMQASDVASTITNLMPERTSLSLIRLELADPATGAPRAFAVTIRGFARGNADLYELERRLTARGSFSAVTVSENAPTDTPGGRVQQFTVTCRMPVEEPAGTAAPGARVAQSGGSR